MTAEEFWDYCGRAEFDDRKLELVRGEVIDRPLEGERHGTICANVAYLLIEHSRNLGRYNVASNNVLFLLRCHPDTVRGPDLVAFDGDPFREPPETFFSTTPLLLAVEVLSGNDTLEDVRERVADLLAYGTPVVWIIDLGSRTIAVHTRGGVVGLGEGDELIGAGRFLGFRHSVGEILTGPAHRWKREPS
jgi:Uma2 family endonuclease